MDLRLIYRIASMKPLLPLGASGVHVDVVALTKKVQAEMELIKRVPVLQFDNVAQFYAQHTQQLWDIKDDFPNWAPPFPRFFAEWNVPILWKIDSDTLTRVEEGEGQTGFFVQSLDLENFGVSASEARQFFTACCGGPPNSMDTSLGARFETAAGKSRWLLLASWWYTDSKKPFCGQPIWTGVLHGLFISSGGSCLDYFSGGLGVQAFLDSPREELVSPLHILGLGLSFCHCKNVSRKEQEIAASPRFHQRQRIPIIKFHTLNINPMRETLRRQGRSDEVGISRALHICRGHFATYTPEHPLFGKYVGTFWRPDHVRGTKESGEVHKKYSVNLDGMED